MISSATVISESLGEAPDLGVMSATANLQLLHFGARYAEGTDFIPAPLMGRNWGQQFLDMSLPV